MIDSIDEIATTTTQTTTLDVLIAAAMEQREREREEAAAAAAAAMKIAAEKAITAMRDMRDTLEQVLPSTLYHALGLAYDWDANVHRAYAAFTVDGEQWTIWHAEYCHDSYDEWRVVPPSKLYSEYSSENLRNNLLSSIADYRLRQAEEIATKAPAKAQTIEAKAEPRLLSERGGTRIYEIDARSGCGSISQYSQTVVSIDDRGRVELASLWTMESDDSRRPEITPIPAEAMRALVALYPTAVAELNQRNGADGNEEPPF